MTLRSILFISKEVGAELGVDFVLEGSIRRHGETIRIKSQLVDARTGFKKWAERYDRDLAEVFAIQDEVTDSILAALAIGLDSPQGRGTRQFDAADLLVARLCVPYAQGIRARRKSRRPGTRYCAKLRRRLRPARAAARHQYTADSVGFLLMFAVFNGPPVLSSGSL